MSGTRRVPLLLLALTVACGARAAEAAAPRKRPSAKAPAAQPDSSNAGRKGTYVVQTANARYSYYVCVPETYSETNPAGLHLFFHGEGNAATAPAFAQWSKHFLEPYNLIGINMQYDVPYEEAMADAAGRAAVAAEAIQRTARDYKVILGRGVVASFGGGGAIHEQLMARLGRSIPFNHVSLYGSYYTQPPPPAAPPMSWFMSVGTGAWKVRLFEVGPAQVRRAAVLFANAARGGCADVYLKIYKGGHAMPDGDVGDAAAQFHRSDIAFAPFLYEGDYADRQVLKAVQSANRREFAKAAAACEALAAGEKAEGDAQAAAAAVKAKIDARIEAMIALINDLAKTDPPLAASYGAVFAKQLAGHPRKKDLDAALAAARQVDGARAAGAAFQQFCVSFKGFIQGRALNDAAVPILEAGVRSTPDTSLLGRMSREYLELRSGF
ncbi:MAG: hypothetical protein IMZ66_07285 [Planctomycetes bacterium]|nr:hypothetical protein [Planctomycetota bacterium]